MVSEAVSKTESPPLLGPRISFSADLSDGGDFICISPVMCKELEKDVVKGSVNVSDFEFLSENVSPQRMLTADELFSEGKLLPFWLAKHSEKLKNINLKTKEEEKEEENRKVEVTMKNKDQENNNNNNSVSWFIDEDPSPRPPKCTVLWKELLRLKKQRNPSSSSSEKTVSSLSPSSSTSSSSSLEDAAKREEREKDVKRGNKKRLERTRSTSMRIRPMIHVPICTPSKSSVPLSPLFPLTVKKKQSRETHLKRFDISFD